MNEKDSNKVKQEVLYKELNVSFVYIIVLFVGLIFLFSMVTYLKDKVNDLTGDVVVTSIDYK